MKQLVTLFWLIVIFFAIAKPSQPQTPESSLFLPAGSVKELLAPPPAADSVTLREQMAVVLWLQQTRTPAQIAFVQQPLDLARFVPLLNDKLLNVDGIELKLTLDAVIAEVRADYDAVKAKFNLPRPFEANSAVEPVTEARPVASYPSGHAIRATVYARLLAEIFPDQEDALRELGQQIGYGRVIAGVHYPIDVLAGQKLGNAYADVIVEQKAFKDAVARIRDQQLTTSLGDHQARPRTEGATATVGWLTRQLFRGIRPEPIADLGQQP